MDLEWFPDFTPSMANRVRCGEVTAQLYSGTPQIRGSSVRFYKRVAHFIGVRQLSQPRTDPIEKLRIIIDYKNKNNSRNKVIIVIDLIR